MPLRGNTAAIKGRPSRVEFTVDHFKQTIQDHGYDVRWSKAVLCPNRDPEQEDHHRVSCTMCDHHGFVYYDPIELKALCTSYGMNQIFMPESRYTPGTAYFTTLPEYKLSFWDKLEILTAQARFSEVVRLTSALSYRLKYPALSIALVLSSRDVVIPDTQYAIVNGNLVFSSLPQGDFVSVAYFYHPTYIIVDLLHSIRDSRVTLRLEDQEIDFPTQAVGRLDFLVRDEGLDGA